MKLRELIIVRRILPKVGGVLSPDQYAYQNSRSTETLLSDLDLFVNEGRNKGKHIYIAGLDISGAFDSASYTRLTEALERVGAPKVLIRFIGNWLPTGNFRIRLNSPLGGHTQRGVSPY